MASEFITIEFPCKSCLVQACCMSGRTIQEKDFDRTMVVAVPTPPKGTTYHKLFLECWVNMGKTLMDNIDKKDVNGTIKNHEIPTQMLFMFVRLTSIFQHMINTTSWNEGKLYEFDVDTLNQKLSLMRLSHEDRSR